MAPLERNNMFEDKIYPQSQVEWFPRKGAEYPILNTINEDDVLDIVNEMLTIAHKHGLTLREARSIFEICRERMLDFPFSGINSTRGKI